MGRIAEDLRYALRILARSRTFAALAIASLALGIGANTTVFTLVNAVLLHPLPVADPNSLVTLYTRDAKNPGYLPSSYLNFRDYRDHNTVFSSLVLYTTLGVSLTGQGEPVPLLAQLVSGNFFDALGVRPRVGRWFLPEEDNAPGAHPIAVISYALWQKRFGGDPKVMEQSLQINNSPFRIVGVAPPDFHGVNALVVPDVWVPSMMYGRILPTASWMNQRRFLFFSVFGRLKPGVGIRQAAASMQGVARELEQQYPNDNQGRSVELLPLSESTINPNQRGNLSNAGVVLMTVAGLVLLIACANVANLLLARAAGRSREIAIRVALGASRWQIVRQLLIESVLLSLAGGAVGLLVARWARDAIWSARPPVLKQLGLQLQLDGVILAFTFGVAALAGVLFGLVPALRASRSDLVTDLKDRAGQSAPTGPWNPRSMLVVAQVALSLIALIGAGLFVRSLQRAQEVDPGFQVNHLVLVQFNLTGQAYNEARGREFQRQALERIAAIPGVQSAALAVTSPFLGGFSRTVLIEGEENTATGKGRIALGAPVTPRYLTTMGIPILRGRDFTNLDQPGTPRVAVINDVMASRYWPGQEAIGKRFRFAGDNAPVEVIGIARTANYLTLGEDPRPLAYISMVQTYSPLAVVHARVSGDAGAVLTSIRREVQSRDPNLLLDSNTMPNILRNSLWAPRLAAGLLGGFGLLALVLTTVGLYGVISYTVGQRVREIGVRMALGASGIDVQRMIVLHALRLVIVGVAIGCVTAVASARLVQSLLFGIKATDTFTFLIVPVGMIAVAMIACWIPAWRATRVDPVLALRHE